MLSIRHVSLAVLFAATALCCSCKDDSNAGKNKDKSGKAAGPHKLEFTAPAFYTDWTTTRGAALMKKYGDKPVTITGTVFHVVQGGEYGEYTMFIDAGKHKLMAKFSDKGKAANAKKIGKGSQVKVKCKPAGMIGHNISLHSCTLQ